MSYATIKLVHLPRSFRPWIGYGLALSLILLMGARRAPSHAPAAADAPDKSIEASATPASFTEIATVHPVPNLSTPPAPTATANQSMELMHDLPSSVTAMAPDPAPEASVGSTRILWMEVTAYCACKKCCGPHASGLTASGRSVTYNNGTFVAADTTRLPFGTRLMIAGYNDGKPVEVIDRGSAIKGNRLDVFFPSHDQALTWGRRWIAVAVAADGADDSTPGPRTPITTDR